MCLHHKGVQQTYPAIRARRQRCWLAPPRPPIPDIQITIAADLLKCMAMPQDKVAEFMGDTESFSTCIIYRYVLVAVCDSDITRSLF
jgi:hypothetical protein